MITVTYSINADGILNVTAVDEASGTKKEIQVKNEKRFTEADINRMVDEAKRMEESDRQQYEVIEARNALETATYSLRNQLPELKVSETQKAELERVVKSTIEWIDRNSTATKEEFDAKRSELEAEIQKVGAAAGGAAGAGQMPRQAPPSNRPTVEEVD